MDEDSARKANLLVGNQEDAPVLELLFTGARFRVLSAAEFAITGATVESDRPQWRNFRGNVGEEISFGQLRAGVWTYLAVQGGFAAPRWFGSASVNPRARFGKALSTGSQLRRQEKGNPPGFSHGLCRSLSGNTSIPGPFSEFGRDPNGNYSRRMSAHAS